MSKQTKNRPSQMRTRRALMNLLKQLGPQDAGTLANELGVSAMAVRQHLYEMQREKLAAFDEERRGKGRPAKLWRLTADAERFFPDAHAELATNLVAAMRETFGSDAIGRLLEVRSRDQIHAYRRRIPANANLRRSLQTLAKIRTEEGYMAEVCKEKNGSYSLIENHCPICAAATSCTGLCAAELEVFQKVLGKNVNVERTEHIIAGDRRCVYRVESKKERR